MRISDWSSDVCSSDLGVGIYLAGVYVSRTLGGVLDTGDIEQVALLQRLAAVRGRLSLCADQAAAAKWWLSMPMASVSAEGPMPKALSTRRTSPLMPGCRHQGRACPLRRARMTSNPLIVVSSEEHTSELQSLMRISYVVFCLKTQMNFHDSL